MTKMNFVTIRGITLHYTLDGLPGGKPLVFINSLGADLRIWDKLVPNFVDRYSIVRYDKRGHGLSDCPPGPYSIRDHANDLAALLAVLQTKAAVVIGISVGGLIALDYAINQPEGVRAIVLCDTAAKIGTAEFWKERIAAIRKNGLEHIAAAILERWFAPAFSERFPADYQGYHNMLTRTPLEGYIATCQALRAADLRGSERDLKAKALVICGAEDLATPPHLGRQLAESLPEARFELIAEAAHLPCVEQPQVMAKKIERFLRENEDV